MIDLTNLLDTYDGDMESIKEILVMYLDLGAPLVSKLSSAVNSNDLTAVMKLSHQLKGSSSNVGALVVAERAAVLELLGKSKDSTGINEALSALIESFEGTRRHITATYLNSTG